MTKAYSSNLTRAQFELIEPLLPAAKPGGHPRSVCLWSVLNGILYVVENGWQHFTIDCEGRAVSVTVKPKVWKKLTTADEQYESWVAAVTGRIGELTPEGFVLEDPNIQAFERKPKAARV